VPRILDLCQEQSRLAAFVVRSRLSCQEHFQSLLREFQLRIVFIIGPLDAVVGIRSGPIQPGPESIRRFAPLRTYCGGGSSATTV
jgi:hypothetical protein